MLVEENKYIDDTSNTTAQLSPEKMLRLQREAEEDYYRRQRSVQTMFNRQHQENESQWNELTTSLKVDSLQAKLLSQQSETDIQQKKLISLYNEAISMQKEIKDKQRTLTSLSQTIHSMYVEIRMKQGKSASLFNEIFFTTRKHQH